MIRRLTLAVALTLSFALAGFAHRMSVPPDATLLQVLALGGGICGGDPAGDKAGGDHPCAFCTLACSGLMPAPVAAPLAPMTRRVATLWPAASCLLPENPAPCPSARGPPAPV